MDIPTFLQNSLKVVWVILGLSALILILGWILGRWIAKLVVVLLNRTPIVNFVVNRLKLPDAELFNHRIRQVTRILVVLLSIGGAWQILNSHPDISEFVMSAWQTMLNFVQLPVSYLYLKPCAHWPGNLCAVQSNRLGKGWVSSYCQSN